MTALIIGMAIGFPCGYAVRRAMTRRLWVMERAIRRRAQGRQ